MNQNSFGARGKLSVDDESYEIYRRTGSGAPTACPTARRFTLFGGLQSRLRRLVARTDKVRHDLTVGLEGRFHVHNQVLPTGRPLMASTVTGLSRLRSLSKTSQARRIQPLIRMASEPHTPWAQERRKDSEPSISHVILCSASRTPSVPYMVSG